MATRRNNPPPEPEVVPVDVIDEPAPEETLAAYEASIPLLKALSADYVVPIGIELQTAGLQAITLVRLARQPEHAARLALYHPDILDPQTTHRLEMLAGAAIHLGTERLVDAAATNRMVPADLIKAATDLKTRLLKLTSYWLDDHPEAGPEIIAIRAGTGYLDLAMDLRRLATLLEQHRELLAQDRKHYRADDLSEARRLAKEIINAITEPETQALADMALRCGVLLRDTYNDLRQAMLFALRKKLRPEAIPSLYAANRGGRPRRKKDEPTE